MSGTTRKVLFLFFCVAGQACAAAPPQQPMPLWITPAADPYVVDVFADEPLAHWRLDGGAEGALNIADNSSTAFVPGRAEELAEAMLGGSEFAIEFWTRGGAGEAVSYRMGDGSAPLRVSLLDEGRLEARIAGGRIECGRDLELEGWRLVGLSWRSSDGLATLSLDGERVCDATLGRGWTLPGGGRLMAGGDFRGLIDEVAVFDHFKHPADWLHRRSVALGKSAPSTPDDWMPLQVVEQVGHGSSPISIVWSPKGHTIATGGNDRSVKVWDAQTRTILRTMTGHMSRVVGLAYSADGARLYSAGQFDGVVKVWDPHTAKLLETIDTGDYILAMEVSPDGTKIAFGIKDSGTRLKEKDVFSVLVWDLASRRQVLKFSAHDHFISALAWSLAGDKIITASHDKSAKVWDARSGAELARVGHTEPFYDLSRSPGRDTVALETGFDVLFWDLDGETKLQSFKDIPQISRSIAWRPSGDGVARLTTSSVVVWDPDNPGDPKTIDLEKHNIAHDFAWSPAGGRVVMGMDNGAIKIIDVSTAEAESANLVTDAVTTISWSPDGRRVAVGGSNSPHLRVWDLEGLELAATVSGNLGGTTEAAFSPDGGSILSISGDRQARLLTTDGEALRSFPWTVQSGSWSPDGGKIFFQISRETRAVARVNSDHLQVPDVHRDEEFNFYRWSPDGSLIAFVSDGHVDVWNVKTGATVSLHGSPSRTLAIRPDNGAIAIGGEDGIVQVWDLSAQKRSYALPAHEAMVWDLSWSPDGQMIASAAVDGVRIFEAETGRRLKVIDQHLGSSVAVVKWRPDSKMLATGGGWDLTTMLWSVPDFEHLATIPRNGVDVGRFVWSPDGRRIASGGYGGLKVWDVEKKVAVSFKTAQDSWLVVDDEGYFDAGGAGGGGMLNLVQGNRSFTVEQLALRRNRPDRIFAKFGGSAQTIRLFEKLWQRRISRLGLDHTDLPDDFSSAPKVKVLRREQSKGGANAALDTVFFDKKGLAGYRVFVNGVPLGAALTPLSGQRSGVRIEVPLTRGANAIEISAINRQGVWSLDTRITVVHEGETLPEPELFFLGVGVSDYMDDRIALDFADKDALDLAEVFAASETSTLKVHVQTLVNDEVNPAGLARARAFMSRATEHDIVVMFIAGHGLRTAEPPHTFYYLDHDARIDDLKASAIPFEAIESLLYDASSRQKLFLLDTCQSGTDVAPGRANMAAMGGLAFKPRSVNTALLAEAPSFEASGASADAARFLSMLQKRDRMIIQDLDRRSGALVLASSLASEASLEADVWGNGAFTSEIIRALTTRVADLDNDGKIQPRELLDHVSKAVPEITKGRQHPNMRSDNPKQNFALPITEMR